jgi:PTS system N-acetylglucosamine-specific IIC component
MSATNPASPISTGTHLSSGDRILGALQSIGRSLMLPIAVMPAAALLLRLGQDDILQLVGLHQTQVPWLSASGNAIFANLPMIFAVGIGFGLAAGDGAAALAALIGYLVFNGVFNTVIPQVNGAPDPNITMGALGGLLVGLVTAGLYRRFHDIRLPDYLAFFGGRRFVPIITALVMLILGIVFGLIWPPINSVVNAAGTWVIGLGALGAGLYGFFNRLLLPLGLHHILNFIAWQQLGSFTGPAGVVHGDFNRYFAGDPTAGNFMAGFFPVMMFGLPAACLAMIRQARFSKVAAGILVSAALASLITGVTEPIEFAFMFVAPVLFLVHALLTGTALAICTLLNIRIGFGFSAGLIDYILNFGKSNTTNPLLILLVGAVYAVLYYFLFSFIIRVFDLATPGRGEARTGLSADWILPESQRGPKPGTTASVEPETEVTSVSAGDGDNVLAAQVLAALGGKTNVQSVEGCITRLRLFVGEPSLVDDAQLKSLGASGVIKRGKVVQVVLGTQSDRIAERVKQLMKNS